MRFFHSSTLTANSCDPQQARVSRKRIGAKVSVQSNQPQLIVFFPSTIFLQQILCPAQSPRNLTEFLFARNFSNDLEVL